MKIRQYLLIMFAVAICVLLQAKADFEPPIRIQSVLSDPVGTDTGGEYVRIINTGSVSRDISGWDLDADQLPYFTFPAGTILAPGAILTVYLRQNGLPSTESLYTGATFGTTNMGNTKGMVALFRSRTHDAGSLEDFVQWGAGNQTHSQIAGLTGLFDPDSFTLFGLEGEEMVFVPSTVEHEGESGTGEALEEDAEIDGEPIENEAETPDPVVEEPPIIRLAYVAMNNPTGVADYIGIYIEDAKTLSSSGRLLNSEFLQVDAQKLNFQGMYVHTGDVLHISVGTGSEATTAIKQNTRLLRWEQLSGLVATTEQVLLYTSADEIADGVCWERGVLPQAEVLDMQNFKSMFWQGSCVQSDIVSQGAYLEQDLEISLDTQSGRQSQSSFWHIITPNLPQNVPTSVALATNVNSNTVVTAVPIVGGIPQVNTSTCTLNPEVILISEFLPNPEGEDTGKEWIELFNTSSSEVVLCGLLLDDMEGGSKPFDPTGYRIPPNGYLLIADTVSKISLGNTSDSVRLLGQESKLVYELAYQGAPSGKSFSRVE